MKKAVVLLSGGLDSATCLAIAKHAGFSTFALSFSYGQRHDYELTAAQCIAKDLKAEAHHIIQLDTSLFRASALTNKDMEIPPHQDSQNIPVTYVPARNAVFLSMALGFAESMSAFDIFIGANTVDYSGYPDCRPEFMHAFQHMANLATKASVEGHSFTIHTPLMYLSKAEIIAEGVRLNVDYSLTVSCYQLDPDGLACGCCDSCFFRRQGFQQASVPDPTRYLKHTEEKA